MARQKKDKQIAPKAAAPFSKSKLVTDRSAERLAKGWTDNENRSVKKLAKGKAL